MFLPRQARDKHRENSKKMLFFAGYRWYDAKGINFTTGFPFGHGLSYTSFKYSDVKVSSTTISATIENTGQTTSFWGPLLTEK
jgi:hypothetical protein